MDAAVAGLLGALIGAVAGFAGTITAHFLQARKERQQWLRTKKEDAYLNTIRYLVRLLKYRMDHSGPHIAINATSEYKDFFDLISEAQIWLTSLTVYCSEKEKDNLKKVAETFADSSVGVMQAAQKLAGTHLSVPDRKEIRIDFDFPNLWETYQAVLAAARIDLEKEVA